MDIVGPPADVPRHVIIKIITILFGLIQILTNKIKTPPVIAIYVTTLVATLISALDLTAHK